MTKRKTGRVDVAFENIEKFAAVVRAPVFDAFALTSRSSVWRCKDGSLTVSLRFKGEDGVTGTQTIRNVRGVK